MNLSTLKKQALFPVQGKERTQFHAASQTFSVYIMQVLIAHCSPIISHDLFQILKF
jgi:hypothetical protein